MNEVFAIKEIDHNGWTGRLDIYLKGDHVMPEHTIQNGPNGSELYARLSQDAIEKLFSYGQRYARDIAKDIRSTLPIEKTDFKKQGSHYVIDDASLDKITSLLNELENSDLSRFVPSMP